MRKFNIIAGLFFTIFFLYHTLKKIEYGKLYEILLSARPDYVVYTIFIYIIILLMRSERWRIILYPISPGFLETFKIFVIGAASLYVLPARMGEFIRPILLKRRNYSSSSVFATVVFERLLDGMCQIILFSIVLYNTGVEEKIKMGGYALAGFYSSVFVFVVLMKVNSELVKKMVNFFFSWFPKIKKIIFEIIDNFSKGLNILSDYKRVLNSILYSVVSWFFMLISTIVLLQAFRFEFENIFLVSVFLQFIITMGMVIPAAPGYIGTFHYFCVLGLQNFGVGKEEALAFAIFYHALGMIIILVPGIICFVKEGITYKQLLSQRNDSQD